MNIASVYTHPFGIDGLQSEHQEPLSTPPNDEFDDSAMEVSATSSAEESSSVSPEIGLSDHNVNDPASTSSNDSNQNPTSETRNDEEPVYTNLVELAAMQHSTEPPTPETSDQPRRVMPGGWMEYVNDKGRSYFFNPATGKCQWIPPRLMRTPQEVRAFMESTTKSMENYTLSNHVKTRSLSPAPIEVNVERVRDSTSLSPTLATALESPILEGSPPPRLRDSVFGFPKDGCAKLRETNEHGEERDRVMSMSTFQSTGPFVMPSMSQSQSLARISGNSSQSPPVTRSISFKNRAASLKQVPLPQVLPTTSSAGVPHFDAPPPPYVLDEAIPQYAYEGMDLSAEERYGRGGSAESARFHHEVRTVFSGMVERVIGEKAARRREWTSCYLFLSSAHLLVYKDEKSAEKHGKHYDAPLLACDLRGAAVSWVVEKEKRKRRIFQVEISDGQSLMLRAPTDSLTEKWFDHLLDVISQLPSCSAPTSTLPCAGELPAASASATVLHNPLSLSRNSSAVGSNRPHSTCTVSRAPRKESKNDPMSTSCIEPQFTSNTETQTPSKDSIIERLKRFFRTRPTVEVLKEKGIYKPEPVFGSTLQAICQLEHSLVPKFIQVVCELIEHKGLEVDGLYRVSGNLSAVQKIRCQVDQNRYQLLVNEEDVHVLTGALKLFFRELVEPVFPASTTKDYLGAIKLQNAKQRFKRFDELLGELPDENRETLKMLLRHLMCVAKNAHKNRMQAHNLAIMFGPTLFSSGEEPRVKKKVEKKNKKKDEPAPVQSNSHLAFNMIMQGQIVEYLLNEQQRFAALQGPIRLQRE